MGSVIDGSAIGSAIVGSAIAIPLVEPFAPFVEDPDEDPSSLLALFGQLSTLWWRFSHLQLGCSFLIAPSKQGRQRRAASRLSRTSHKSPHFPPFPPAQ